MFGEIDAKGPVSQLVSERPERARVFNRLGIDFSSGGEKPLDKICRERSLDLNAVLYDLQESDARTTDADPCWMSAPMGKLADEIVSVHHQFLRRALPAISYLLERVAEANRNSHPELMELKELFADFRSRLETSMDKEEEMLFPVCRQMDQQRSSGKAVHPRRILYLVSVLERNHECAIESLSKIRFVTNGFVHLPDCGNTYRVLMDSLSDLEADMHVHMHLEDDILFPRAVGQEAQVPMVPAKLKK
jgi:regulator of cell morphogenesis and NO signaling